ARGMNELKCVAAFQKYTETAADNAPDASAFCNRGAGENANRGKNEHGHKKRNEHEAHEGQAMTQDPPRFS
ncbi:MAG: hypothetical protein ACXW3Z_04685, partial [Limisphaerales bacterium]